MEKIAGMIVSRKTWNPERNRYEQKKSYDWQDLLMGQTIDFGGITIGVEAKPPIKDPLDTTSSVILRREKGVKPPELHVFELRSSYDKPREHIVGKTIMQLEEAPFFYFSHLGDLMGIQIYNGSPSKNEHPEMIEIAPATQIGESPTSALL